MDNNNDDFDALIDAYENLLKENIELMDKVSDLEGQIKISVKMLNQYKSVYDLHVSLSKMAGEKDKVIN